MDREQLISEIKDAFRGVTLEDGVSLNMCKYKDSGGSAKKYLELAKNDERNDWTALLEGDLLTRFQVTFSFTDGKGFRFYLPAYMIWSLRNFENSDAYIIDGTVSGINSEFRKDIKNLLSEQQLAVAEKFLEFAVTHERFDSKIASENLEKLRNIKNMKE